MSGAESPATRAAVAAWLAHADDDRRSAVLCLAADPPLPGIAAFHCQQAVEKLLKALLVHVSVSFRKTHSLVELGDAVAVHFPNLADTICRAETITFWGVAYRYPAEESPEDFPNANAFADALSIIDRLCETVRPFATPTNDHAPQ
jgi:HEPN domain-containing protein